jgi:hypothetical protein
MKSDAVKIYGNNVQLLSIKLTNILECIDNGDEYKWSILWLDAIGDLKGKPILDLEKEIRDSENGLSIEWDDLVQLSREFDQVIEILIIGDKDASIIKRYDSDEEMHSKCQYTIELLDSSYWIVHSKNSDSLKGIRNNLQGVENI